MPPWCFTAWGLEEKTWVQNWKTPFAGPACRLADFKAVFGFSFSPSTTRCFTALAPIPALDTAQWGTEIRSAARNSQTRDFGEQGRGGLCSVLFSYVGTVHLGCLLELTSCTYAISDTTVVLSVTIFVSYKNCTFKWTSLPRCAETDCSNWAHPVLLVFL